MKVLIKWRARDKELIERIREYFGMPRYTTLNGITPADIADDKLDKLKEGERMRVRIKRNQIPIG